MCLPHIKWAFAYIKKLELIKMLKKGKEELLFNNKTTSIILGVDIVLMHTMHKTFHLEVEL